jgi:hypothetical protein
LAEKRASDVVHVGPVALGKMDIIQDVVAAPQTLSRGHAGSPSVVGVLRG